MGCRCGESPPRWPSVEDVSASAARRAVAAGNVGVSFRRTDPGTGSGDHWSRFARYDRHHDARWGWAAAGRWTRACSATPSVWSWERRGADSGSTSSRYEDDVSAMFLFGNRLTTRHPGCDDQGVFTPPSAVVVVDGAEDFSAPTLMPVHLCLVPEPDLRRSHLALQNRAVDLDDALPVRRNLTTGQVKRSGSRGRHR